MGVYDTVKVDLPDATFYGTVCQVDADRVQVRSTRGERLLWGER
ncbi:hypothetical protein [Streptomyces sp. NPDC101166]